MPRCRAETCTREAETAWITDDIDEDGYNVQQPVCGRHLVRLANREHVEFRDCDPGPKRPSEWVLRVQLPSGQERYYGPNWWGGDFTPAPGDATRYESENAAKYIGYQMKDRNQILDFTVEEIMNPRRTPR